VCNPWQARQRLLHVSVRWKYMRERDWSISPHQTLPNTCILHAPPCCRESNNLVLYPAGGGLRSTWVLKSVFGSPADLIGQDVNMQVLAFHRQDA
jgi:hypothetical protein